MGYADNYLFTDIFEAHCVPGFIPGDMDNSGGIDISDVVFVVDFQFNGGTPPPRPSAMDVDASGRIDIVDLVWLVDYFFHGGTAPRAGCIDYYDGYGPNPSEPLYWHDHWHPSSGRL